MYLYIFVYIYMYVYIYIYMYVYIYRIVGFSKKMVSPGLHEKLRNVYPANN